MSMVKDFKVLYEQNIDSICPIYLGILPKTKNDLIIGLNQNGGMGMDKADELEQTSLQVMVRSTDYEIAIDLLNKVKRYHQDLADVTINNHRYLASSQLGDIVDLTNFDNGQFDYIFSLNFIILHHTI